MISARSTAAGRPLRAALLPLIILGAVSSATLVACTATAGLPASPTASASPTVRVTGTAPSTPGEPLDAMLPTVVLGHALRPSAGEAAVIRAEIAMMAEDLLSSEGRTTRDLEVAERDNLSDGGSRVSVVAVRLPGVKALRLLDAYLGGFVASPFGHVSERQLNGRAVSCTFRDGNPIWVCWWPRHDVVFGASSDEFLLIREGIAAIV